MMYKTDTPNWHLSMAERHAEKLAHENAALRAALRLKEAECEVLHSDVDRLCEIIHGMGDGDER